MEIKHEKTAVKIFNQVLIIVPSGIETGECQGSI